MMRMKIFGNHIYFVLVFAGICHGDPATVESPLTLTEHFNIFLKNGKLLFFLLNNENGKVLRGELGVTLSKTLKSEIKIGNNHDYIQFGDAITLSVEKFDQCHYLNWMTSENVTFEDCIDYESDYWYGGPESSQQFWPFNNMTYKHSSYVTKADRSQAVAEPYWVSSSGFYIFVNRTTPLFIDANNDYPNKLCLIAKQSDPYLPRGRSYLGYKICAYDNIRISHIKAVRHELGTPSGLPDKRIIQHPIWSTWVRYKANINQTAVLQYAHEIVSHGFNNSQIEIDDNWETCYGSGQFNLSRFPDMSKLSSDLHSMGFRVTLWTHPFVNEDCKLFSYLKSRGYLIQSHTGNFTSDWWNGKGGVVDFTNAHAAQWFLNHRRSMMDENKIDSLKMDAGESSYPPQIPKLNADVTSQPNAFTVAFVNTVSQFGNMIEVRTGYGTQNLPVFVRMLDRSSNWSFQNGLATLITTLLQFNLNGYTFVLPDMVGGNAYGETISKELFIRWLQANTFMPTIQFSKPPWDFDEETVKIAKKFTSLHYLYSGTIIRRMEECVRTGVPVNAPIWWIAPKDPVAHTIWSEFMLGDDILVAPVVEEGAKSRDIYLPSGIWRDEADSEHKVYNGQRWLRNYSAPLDTLPFFTRLKSCEYFE